MLFLISCGSSTPITLAIDNKFTDHEASLIMSAIDEWVLASDSEDAVVIFSHVFDSKEEFTIDEWDRDEDDYGLLFKIKSTDIGYLDLIKERGKGFLGLAGGDNIALRMDAVHYDFVLRRLMMHEIGHLYGMDHAKKGLMSNNKDRWLEGNDCVHRVDLEQFCELNTCGPDAHATCNFD